MRFLLPPVLIGLLASVILCAPAVRAGQLVSGPMLGYQAHRETFIWLEVREAKVVALDYWLAGRPDTRKTIGVNAPPPTPGGGQIVHFRPGLLEMGAAYEYRLSVDGQPLTFPYPLTFRTTDQWEWRKPPPDFSFLFGTCAYLNDEAYDRPGTPYGKGTEIFRHMGASGADFTLWGGDNLYLREADYSSESGIWYRYSHDRATPDLQPLFASMHHYATWDDHDYGPNDANKSYEFKATTLAAFKAYWGNPAWGEPDNPGVYSKFFWGDAAFLLLDNRYHRDDSTLDQANHPTKTQYGPRQLDWLKQSLLQAQQLGHYAFKFIVTGGQVITSFGGSSETFDYFRHEREEILQFIRDQKITGVVFLSGDVHFTELARTQLTDSQWVYELTSSPLSSGASNVERAGRLHDPMRIDGTLVVDQNYTKLSLSGPADDRVLTIRCYDRTNALRWEHAIKASELK